MGGCREPEGVDSGICIIDVYVRDNTVEEQL